LILKEFVQDATTWIENIINIEGDMKNRTENQKRGQLNLGNQLIL
jgi:hypothetical protein